MHGKSDRSVFLSRLDQTPPMTARNGRLDATVTIRFRRAPASRRSGGTPPTGRPPATVCSGGIRGLTAGIGSRSTGSSGSAVRPDRRSESAFFGGKIDFTRFRISASRTFFYVYRRNRTGENQARRPRRRECDTGRQPAISPGTDRRGRPARTGSCGCAR